MGRDATITKGPNGYVAVLRVSCKSAVQTRFHKAGLLGIQKTESISLIPVTKSQTLSKFQKPRINQVYEIPI